MFVKYRLALVALLAQLLAGCSSVSIQHGAEPPLVAYKPGFIDIQLGSESSVVVESRTLGWHSSSVGNGLGLIYQRFALINDECSLVLWINSEEQLDAAREIVRKHPGLCIGNP